MRTIRKRDGHLVLLRVEVELPRDEFPSKSHQLELDQARAQLEELDARPTIYGWLLRLSLELTTKHLPL
jgi:hypothetical protein